MARATKTGGGLGLGTPATSVSGLPGGLGIPKGTPGFGAYRPAVPPAGQVTLYRLDGGLFLNCRQGPEPPKLSAGYGGWQEVPRPRRVALLDWQGSSPFRLEISLVLGSHALGQSIEAGRRILDRLATRQGAPEPPQVGVTARGLPETVRKIPAWAVESLEWGAVSFTEAGQPAQQAATVILAQHPSAEQITLSAPPRRVDCSKAKAPANEKHYIARHGDSLRAISARFLGSAQCWKRIQRLNQRTGKFEAIRDPKSLKAGDRLRFP